MKKLLLSIIIITIIIFTPIDIYAEFNPEAEIIITERKCRKSEDWLWEQLIKYTDNNPVLSAGILGYFYRESNCKSNIVAGSWYLGSVNAEQLNLDFTAQIDNGLTDGTTKEDFNELLRFKYGGYGLGQWSTEYYNNLLFDFAQEWGTSIADAEMQCAFTVKTIKEHPSVLWDLIKNEDDVKTVGRYISIFYDGSESAAETIANKAKEYYDRYTL